MGLPRFPPGSPFLKTRSQQNPLKKASRCGQPDNLDHCRPFAGSPQPKMDFPKLILVVYHKIVLL